VFNIVTLFRSSKSIYRPNFIDTSQFTAETSTISRVCTVVQYAVLEAMTRVYRKTENSTPRKYKMDKDIQTPPRIYDYVAELSCCAQSEQNRLTQFCWGNRGSLSLFTHTHTGSQTNSFISPTDHNYGRI